MEEFISSWGLPVGCWTSANCPVANVYTITGIDAAVDLTIDIWVEAVPTVGVGAVWGCGCRNRLGRNFHLVPSFGDHSSFSFVTCPGSWGFAGHRTGILGAGASGRLWLGWSQLCLLGPSLPSNSKYVFIFHMREG